MKTISFLCSVVLSFSFVGCTGGTDSGTAGTGGTNAPSSPSSSDPGGDSSSEGTSERNAAAGAECNAIAQRGSSVPVTILDGTVVPSAKGGTVSDGTYVLTAVRFYTSSSREEVGPISDRGASTMEVRGTTIQYVRDDLDGESERKTMTFEREGTALAMTETCVYRSVSGAGKVAELDPSAYTATATSLVIHEGDETGAFVYEFSKR